MPSPDRVAPRPPAAAGSLPAAAQAWESLFRAQVAVMRRLQADDTWDEVGIGEYDVLFTLAGCGERAMRLRELNRYVLLSQPSLSRLVDRLSDRGLLVRRPDPGDGRGTVVALTDAGAALQQRVGRRHVQSIHRLLGAVLDDDELATLARLTQELRSGVEASTR